MFSANKRLVVRLLHTGHIHDTPYLSIKQMKESGRRGVFLSARHNEVVCVFFSDKNVCGGTAPVGALVATVDKGRDNMYRGVFCLPAQPRSYPVVLLVTIAKVII